MNLLRDTRKHRKKRSMKHRKVKSKKHRKVKSKKHKKVKSKKHIEVKSRNIKNTKNKKIYSGGYYKPEKFTKRSYGEKPEADHYVRVHAGTYKDSLLGETYQLHTTTNGIISGFRGSGYGVRLTDGEHTGTQIWVTYDDVDHNPNP